MLACFVIDSCGPSHEDFGSVIAGDGDLVVIGAPYRGSPTPGSPYVCVGKLASDGVHWEAKIEPRPEDEKWGFFFGSALEVTGTQLVVGNPGGDSGDGPVQIFERSGGKWSQGQLIESPQPSAREASISYGGAVAARGDSLYVGSAVADSTDGEMTGVVHTFERGTSGRYRHVGDISAGAAGADEFGHALQAADSRLAVSESSHVYIFEGVPSPKTASLRRHRRSGRWGDDCLASGVDKCHPG